MNSYNTHLSELRKAKKLSIVEAAKAIGINRMLLYCYENGYFRPSKKALKKLEDFYGEKLTISGEAAYPTPLKEKAIKEEKRSLSVKRIVFGAISGFILLTIVAGAIMFNASVNNADSYYGEIYNDLREEARKNGEIGHDLVTALEYKYISKNNASDSTTIIFYETDNILYFNECTYSTTYLEDDYGVVRYHYQFGSNLGVKSNVCDFKFGSWSRGVYFSCSFTYEGEKITKLDNLNVEMDIKKVITEEKALFFANKLLDTVEISFSKLISQYLNKDVSFYRDFLPAREQGRVVNFALQVTGLVLMLPGILAFFVIFGLFVRSMIANIKPRLVTTTANPEGRDNESLPKDINMKIGIPDTFIIFFSKFLQYGSIVLALLAFLAKLGLPFPGFMATAEFMTVLGLAWLGGIFLEHFVMIGRIKKATTLFETIVFNLFLFFLIATVETVLILITNAWGYDFASLIIKYLPSNVYQVVAVHYLIFLFLFFQPSFLNKKKKWVRILWHSLSFIPLGGLIAIYFLSNAYALTYGVKENIFVNFWFPNGFLLLSIVCVIFMYATFALRLYYERRYGKQKSQTYFYGDRYTLMENIICSALIVIAGALDFIFVKNQYAHYLGLGSNYWIFIMIPFILLCKYSPNNQQLFIFKDEIEIPLRTVEEE